MPESPNAHARALGLKFNENGLRLTVPKGSPAADLWNEALLASNPTVKRMAKGSGPRMRRKTFKDLESLIEHHAPKIWGLYDRSGLLIAYEYDEYQKDLFWPQHRQEIISTFRKLYNARIKKRRAAVKAKKATEGREQKKRKAAPKRRAKRRVPTASKQPTKNTSAKSPNLGVPMPKKAHVIPEDKVTNLTFTRFWLLTADGSQQAEMSLSEENTTIALFEGISHALSGSQNSETRMIGTITIYFPWHLGNLSGSIVINREDDDEVVKQLKLRLIAAWKEVRERSGEGIYHIVIVDHE